MQQASSGHVAVDRQRAASGGLLHDHGRPATDVCLGTWSLAWGVGLGRHRGPASTSRSSDRRRHARRPGAGSVTRRRQGELGHPHRSSARGFGELQPRADHLVRPQLCRAGDRRCRGPIRARCRSARFLRRVRAGRWGLLVGPGQRPLPGPHHRGGRDGRPHSGSVRRHGPEEAATSRRLVPPATPARRRHRSSGTTNPDPRLRVGGHAVPEPVRTPPHRPRLGSPRPASRPRRLQRSPRRPHVHPDRGPAEVSGFGG